jgi:hypothetical protein
MAQLKAFTSIAFYLNGIRIDALRMNMLQDKK